MPLRKQVQGKDAPQVVVVARPDGGCDVVLGGSWTLGSLGRDIPSLIGELAEFGSKVGVSWNCTGINILDSTGALLLWRVWQGQRPAILLASPEQLRVFDRISMAESRPVSAPEPMSATALFLSMGTRLLAVFDHLADFTRMIGQLALDVLHLLRHPREMPRREISANLYKSGVRAMPVTALVGFLIGVVMSYLSALQLKQFGGEVFIVNILGMGIIRELGPVLVAVLIAGRSGSAMTAQLGVMRVTEEIDALATMGVSRSLRLIFPKVLALSVAMPLLVLWMSAVALLGGMLAAEIQLDISYGFFVETLPKVVPVANLWIGLVKGLAFGFTVALVACHFGLRVKPNTESLSANTTSSVVTAITVVIMIDAIIAIATRKIGLF